jgi:hypothetical protein
LVVAFAFDGIIVERILVVFVVFVVFVVVVVVGGGSGGGGGWGGRGIMPLFTWRIRHKQRCGCVSSSTTSSE